MVSVRFRESRKLPLATGGAQVAAADLEVQAGREASIDGAFPPRGILQISHSAKEKVA